MSKKFAVKNLVVALSLMLVLPLTAFGAEKLVVKDGSNNTKFVVHDTGYTGIGTISPVSQLHINSEGFTNAIVTLDTSADNLGTKGQITFKRSRGTISVPTAVLTDDYLGVLAVNAHNGTAYEGNRGFFLVTASENWTPSAGGYRFLFKTRSNGTVGAPTERMRIDHDGTVSINKLAGTYVNGSAYVCVNNSGQIFASEDPCQ